MNTKTKGPMVVGSARYKKAWAMREDPGLDDTEFWAKAETVPEVVALLGWDPKDFPDRDFRDVPDNMTWANYKE